MKQFYAFLFFFCSFIGFAQDPGMLDKTWYLRSITIDGNIDYVPPYENFTFEITENNGEYNAFANGVENTFSGVLEFDSPTETFEFTDIAITLMDCMVLNCDYENLYFYQFLTDQSNEFKTFEYSYFEYSNGYKSLIITDENGNEARYLDYALEDPEPELFQTWYLYSSEGDLGDPVFYYGEDVPQLTIASDLSFSGVENCWEVNGDFEYAQNSFLDPPGLWIVEYEENCILGGSANNFMYTELSSFGGVLSYIVTNEYLSLETYPGFVNTFKNTVTLSTPENSLSEIRVFPNPAKNKLNILGAFETLTAEIYNVQGQSLLKNEIETSIDISLLSAGIYFLKLKKNEQSKVIKFIKE